MISCPIYSSSSAIYFSNCIFLVDVICWYSTSQLQPQLYMQLYRIPFLLFAFVFVSFHSSWFCAAILFVVLCSWWVIRSLFRSLYSLIGLSSNLFIFIYMYLVASSVRGVLCVRILNILFRYIVFLISLWLTRLAAGWASHNEIRLIWETTYGIYAKVRCEEKKWAPKIERKEPQRERTKTTKLTQCVCVGERVWVWICMWAYTRNTDYRWNEYMK